MKKKWFSFLVLLFAVVVSMPTVVSATIISIGDPFDSNSWTQRFEEKGVGYFNYLYLRMISAEDRFENVGINSFSPNTAGWIETANDGIDVVASGDSLNQLRFNINFVGSKTNPLEFYFGAYDSAGAGTFREIAIATWSGSGWSFVTTFDDPWGDVKPIHVPEPTTLLLLGTGLVGIALFTRRILKKEVI